MFTEKQIGDSKSRVKSGADFPRLVQEFIRMGIAKYEHFVGDGSTIYYDAGGHSLKIEEKQPLIQVNDHSSAAKLKYMISIHQAGETNYPTFCLQAAEAGVEKWVSDLDRMTVCYLDKAGSVLLEEPIPIGAYQKEGV